MRNIIALAALFAVVVPASALERYDTQETVVVQRVRPRPTSSGPAPAPANPNATNIALRMGEIRPVFESRGGLFSGAPEAFYLPSEAIGIVQLVVERKGSTSSYFLKALRPGRTAGGVVKRAWLDKSGFRPKTIADEGRIQQALRNKPYYISVR